MKILKINKLSFTAIIIVLYSCTKVIDVNLNDASPQIVIEGIITDQPGPYQVSITKTVNFSAASNYPPVPGATVTITDATNAVTETLTETSPGIYTTNILQGIVGHTYQLSVLVDGNSYTASSTMPQPVLFDSITFQHNSIFGNDFIGPIINFQDPPGLTNYYAFTKWVRGERGDFDQTFDDRLSDGRYIRQQLFGDSIEVGDLVEVEMYCVDKSAYDYLNTFSQVTSGNNGNSVSPANPVSNITNNALGYFSARTVQRRAATAN